jgi:hypothetical protein
VDNTLELIDKHGTLVLYGTHEHVFSYLYYYLLTFTYFMINITRAIWAGLGAYALNLTILSVLSNLIGPFMQGVAWAPLAYQIIVSAVLFASTYLAASWYFKLHAGNPVTGLIVGAVTALTSLVVTITQVLPAILMQNGSFKFILDSFMNWQFWLAVGITVVAGAIAAVAKKK